MMLLVELARHRQTIHSAPCEFSLEQHPEGWRIKQKKVNFSRTTRYWRARHFRFRACCDEIESPLWRYARARPTNDDDVDGPEKPGHDSG